MWLIVLVLVGAVIYFLLQVSKSKGSDGSIIETPFYNVKIMPKSIIFLVNSEHIWKDVDVSVDGDYLLTAKVSKKGMVKVKKNNKIGRLLVNAINGDEVVELRC